MWTLKKKGFLIGSQINNDNDDEQQMIDWNVVFNQIGCGVHNEVAGDTIHLSVKGAVSIGNTL